MLLRSNPMPRLSMERIPREAARIALATPIMINVIEAAALACAEALLTVGHQSLGIRLDVSHIAATPVGMMITAEATVTKVEGRTVHFDVTCRDEKELRIPRRCKFPDARH